MGGLWTDAFSVVAVVIVLWTVLGAWGTYKDQQRQLQKKLDEQLEELKTIRSFLACIDQSLQELRDHARRRRGIDDPI
jgi:hypothetical protein